MGYIGNLFQYFFELAKNSFCCKYNVAKSLNSNSVNKGTHINFVKITFLEKNHPWTQNSDTVTPHGIIWSKALSIIQNYS